MEAEKTKLEADLRGKELQQQETKFRAEAELKEREREIHTQRQVARDAAEREREITVWQSESTLLGAHSKIA